MKILVRNQNASRNYEILETYEAGLILTGTEVKSLSHAQASINDAYILISNAHVHVVNMHVAPFFEGNQFNVDPYRDRELLMHRHEITKINLEKQRAGLTIIPTKVYWHHHKIKMEIALCRGKKLHDKRLDLKNKAIQREIRNS